MFNFDFNQVKNSSQDKSKNLGFDFIKELEDLSNPSMVKIFNDRIKFLQTFENSLSYYTELNGFTDKWKEFLESDIFQFLKNRFDFYCIPGKPFMMHVIPFSDEITEIYLKLLTIAKTLDHCYLCIATRDTNAKLITEASRGKVLIYHHYRWNVTDRSYPIMAKSKVYYIKFIAKSRKISPRPIEELTRILYNKELGACQIDCEKLVIRIEDMPRYQTKSKHSLISLLKDLLNSGNFINPNMRIGFCSHGSTFPKFLQEYFPNSFFFTLPRIDDAVFDYKDIKDL